MGDAPAGAGLVGLEKAGVHRAQQQLAGIHRHHILSQPRVADAEEGLFGAQQLVVHLAYHGQADVKALRLAFHVQAERVGVGKEGVQRLRQVLVDVDEAAEVLHADLDVVFVPDELQIVPHALVRVCHPFFLLCRAVSLHPV